MNSAERNFLYLALFLFALGGVSRLGFLNKLSPLEMIPLPLSTDFEPVLPLAELDSTADSSADIAPTDGTGNIPVLIDKKQKPKKKTPEFPININIASKDDLCFIKGVGPSIAQKIIDYREQKGSFRSAKDLEKVPGIGAKKRAAMEEFVKFE